VRLKHTHTSCVPSQPALLGDAVRAPGPRAQRCGQSPTHLLLCSCNPAPCACCAPRPWLRRGGASLSPPRSPCEAGVQIAATFSPPAAAVRAVQGFLYMLDHQGSTVSGWPVQMGEIQVGAHLAARPPACWDLVLPFLSARSSLPLLGGPDGGGGGAARRGNPKLCLSFFRDFDGVGSLLPQLHLVASCGPKWQRGGVREHLIRCASLSLILLSWHHPPACLQAQGWAGGDTRGGYDLSRPVLFLLQLPLRSLVCIAPRCYPVLLFCAAPASPCLQAQVAVGDINGDGAVEIVVGDARGNIAVFDQRAQEVWERHVGSQINQVRAALRWDLLCCAMLRCVVSGALSEGVPQPSPCLPEAQPFGALPLPLHP
jgi:hypothetical protein